MNATPMTGMQLPMSTGLGAAASFLGMWSVMMAAMMLPSLVPMLRRYRQAIGGSGARLDSLTALVGVGYLGVWTVVGIAAYPLSAAMASVGIRLPVALGAIVLLAGVIQCTGWKAHHLACCRAATVKGVALPGSIRGAVQVGLRYGSHCASSCGALTTILLVLGVMDLRAMVAVTTAITLERLAPAGERIARAIGTIAVIGGTALIARGIAVA